VVASRLSNLQWSVGVGVGMVVALLGLPLNALLIAAFKVGINIELARVYAAVDSGHNCVSAHVDRQAGGKGQQHTHTQHTHTHAYTTFDSLKFDTRSAIVCVCVTQKATPKQRLCPVSFLYAAMR